MNDIPKDYRPLPQNQPKFKDIIKNPTNPSIPSKWETKNISRNNSFDGFGIRTNRFSSNQIENPGPGYYYEDNNSIIKKSSSLSKKGFGNAFLSKCERLPSVLLNNNIAGPGHYQPKTIENIYKSDEKKGKFSLSDKNGRVPYEDPLKNGPKPGPGEYRVDANFLPGYLRSKPTVAFASESGRESFLTSAVNAETPSPLTYNPNPASTLPERKIMWSKSQYKRFQDLGVDNKVPGPGRYFDEKLEEENQRIQELSNKRTVGRKTQKLIGKQNEKPKIAIHTFGADVHRFKHSFLGRLDLAAETPGPGWYAPLNIVSENKQENETRSQSSPPPLRASGVFKMTGPQCADIKKPVEHRPPGPAYYHPDLPKPKSFLHNTDSKWI